MEIESKLNHFIWNIQIGHNISSKDKEFIENFNPVIYHNDIECYLWAFDVKLPSGRYLENIRFSNDLRTATAFIL